MKLLARIERHATRGCSMGREADCEVRPVTSCVLPREWLMNEDANFGELVQKLVVVLQGQIKMCWRTRD
jgi:hypothetical protein